MNTAVQAPNTGRTRYGPVIADREAHAGRRDLLTSINPATGQSLYELVEADGDDVDAAVSAASAALSGWGRAAPEIRRDLLMRVADWIERNVGTLARIETLDNGKILAQATAQIQGLPSVYRYFAGWADKLSGETPMVGDGVLSYVRREPVGVVALVVPWNSPLNLVTVTLAPALATGNTVVIKPSEHASASVVVFAEALRELGIPDGTVNVVTGRGHTTAAALCGHPGIDLISFTGGEEGGRAIAALAARRPLPVLMELGGKSPQIVFADADLERAADGVVAGIFNVAGETCVAGSRCLVEDAVYEDFVTEVVRRADRLRVGDPMNPTSDMGPLAHEQHMQRVLSYIQQGTAEGATLRAGGERLKGEGRDDGFYVGPTVFADVRPGMTIAQDEIFGPVLAAARFASEAEAVTVANGTRFGLAAGVWTRDLERAHRMAERLDAGQIWLNSWKSSRPSTPFGGVKGSGYGRVGSSEVIRELTRLKSVWLELAP